MPYPLPFAELLQYAIDHGASDIHLVSGIAPTVRIDTSLQMLDYPPFSGEEITEFVAEFIGAGMYQKMVATRAEQDFSMSYNGHRFRCNTYFEGGSLAASLRLLSNHIPTMDELGLPSQLATMIERSQGLIIIAGPTGHGKSTTLSAIINKLLSERRWHIITIEDPIEYQFEHKRGVISQREVGTDTVSFAAALRTALREDPDAVMVGEMRDRETVEAAMQLAQTGHLVLTTLHTNSAAQTANRIIDIFPEDQQSQARVDLAESLVGIFSQRLLPKISGGRILATELLLATPAVRSIIREDKTHQLTNVIQTSAADGMISMDKSLAELVHRGEITLDEALSWAMDPKALQLMIY